MGSSLIIITFCLVAGVCLILFAANRALHDVGENRCDMTYMYEYPKYIKVNLRKKVSKQFPRYNLYIYGEGEYAEELTRKLKPKGIPVLFIPGNAGSHRQVRSFASVALRKAETKRYHFNYFTVDFDEDFGGIYGGVLMDQTKFVHTCLRHILRMYNGADSVVIIGHSMGGLIARALYSLEGFHPKMVHLIVTLGTPHVAPIVALDPALTSFYNAVNNIWWSKAVVNNVTIVSLSGGARDLLVPVKLSSLGHISSGILHHSTVATAVPHVWLSIDHLALCWCKQLVLVVNRVLFDMIDQESGQLMKNKYLKSQVLKQHFGDDFGDEPSNGGKTLEMLQNFSLGISNDHQTILDVGHHHLLHVSQTILIPTNKDHGDNVQFVALTKSVKSIRILSCTELGNASICIGMKDLSRQTLPISHDETVEFFHLSASTLAQTSHIVVSGSKPAPVLFTQFTTSVEKIFTNVSFLSSSQTFQYSNSLFINISLPMVRNNFDVFRIRVLKNNCKNVKGDGIFAGRIHVPWSNEDVYANFVTRYELEILLKIHAPKPMAPLTKYPCLQIWNSDKCSLEVKLQYEFGQSMGQLFKIYVMDIPKWVYFWIAIIITVQLAEMSNKGNWMGIWSSVMTKKLLKLLPLFALIASEALDRFLTIPFYKPLASPSSILNSILSYDWFLPNFFSIFSAFNFVIILHLFLKLMRLSVAWFLMCCSSKATELRREKSFYANVMTYGLFGSTVLGLSFLSSSLAMYFVTAVLFLNNCKKTNELIQGNNEVQFSNLVHFSETILLFLVVVCIQTTPAFISWLKVLHYSWSFASDPFFPLICILTPTIILVLREVELKLRPSHYLSWIILSIWSVAFVCLSFDKLPFLLGIILLILDIFVFCKQTQHLKTY